jgi:hypothetical protein
MNMDMNLHRVTGLIITDKHFEKTSEDGHEFFVKEITIEAENQEVLTLHLISENKVDLVLK